MNRVMVLVVSLLLIAPLIALVSCKKEGERVEGEVETQKKPEGVVTEEAAEQNAVKEVANKELLEEAGYEAMLDDRDERPGVKFKDAELIGYPLSVVIGRRTEESGEVEVRRRDGEEQVVVVSEALSAVQKLAAPA